MQTPPTTQTRREDRAGGRHEQRRDHDRDPAGHDRDERRGDAAQEQVLHRVDVAHHAGEEVAAPVPLDASRDLRLERAEEGAPHAREHAERQVVRLESVEVASDRPADAERPHGDHRHGELQDRRVLRGARDHVAGERHEADAEEHRQRAQRDRQGEATFRRPAPSGSAPRACSWRHRPLAQLDGSAVLEPDDPVGDERQLGIVRDQEDGAAGSIARIDARSSRRSPRRGSRSARRGSAAARCRRAPARARGVGFPPPTALARPRRPRCRSRRAARRRPTRTRPAPTRARSPRPRRRGSPSAMLCAHGAPEDRRTLRQPGHLPPPRTEVERRSGRRRPPGHAPRSGSQSPRRSAATVLLPAPLGPTSATTSPRSIRRSNPSSTGRHDRGSQGHPLEPTVRHVRSATGPVAGDAARVAEVEDPLGRRQAVRAHVELRCEAPQRRVELGRQQQHGQRRLKPDRPVDQAARRASPRRARWPALPPGRARPRRGS